MNTWISVNDRLPVIGQECLCYSIGRYFRGIFSGNDFLYEFIELLDGQRLGRYVSHWMPLPEPPREKKDE